MWIGHRKEISLRWPIHLSIQFIKPNYLVIIPPTQNDSFFRNLHPLFQNGCSQSSRFPVPLDKGKEGSGNEIGSATQRTAGMQRDRAPVEWPRSEGRDPTEGSVLGRLLWKPTPVEKGKGESRETTVWRNEKGGWEWINKNLHGASCKWYASAWQRRAKADPRVRARLRRAEA